MSIHNFLEYVLLTESKQNFNKTVALVGGSYKPPTKAHWYMVEQYAKKADEVIVLISDPKNPKSIRKTSNGTVITAQMSKDIFDIYISRYGLQKKVKAIISAEPSPITALFNYVDDNLSDVNVIFGVSKKGGDEARFKSALKYYEDNEHINLLDPMITAVEPYSRPDGKPISATDMRNNLDNAELLKDYLPEKLTDSDISHILSILKVRQDMPDISNESLKPLDETECINIQISDQLLMNSKIACYNVGQTIIDKNGKEQPVNPKKFPEKAIDIFIPINGMLMIELYLDRESRKWDSSFTFNGAAGKLSPDQMGQFFRSNFYQQLKAKLEKEWPLSDDMYNGLFAGVQNCEMLIGFQQTLEEDADDDAQLSPQEIAKKREKRREKAKKDYQKAHYSASGRKLMNFSDIGVKGSSGKFNCWPNPDKAFNWSTWKDWKKIKPLCRIRFDYANGHTYGASVSAIGDDYDHRGFRSYDLTEQPPLQWLSKNENADLMKLSIFNKFIKHCIDRIEKYVSIPTEEIYAKINNKDKITTEEIEATKNVIKKTLKYILKRKQSDDFKWSK